MKTFTLALLIILTRFSIVLAGNPGHNIRVSTRQFTEGKCVLAYHFGDKQYIRDSAAWSPTGFWSFKADTLLDPGIYLVVYPNGKWVEIILDKEQQFTVETDSNDIVGKMKITGSVQNQAFYDYQRQMQQYQIQNDKWDALKKSRPELKDSCDKQLVSLNDEIKNYRRGLIRKYPDFLFTRVLSMMDEPDIPDYPRNEKGLPIDSSFKYRFLKSHYFDGTDFSDPRILRTPVYQPKLTRYFKNLVVSDPDSIIQDLDFVLGRTLANKEVFRFSLITLYNLYLENKTVCMDKVQFHLLDKYYLTDKVDWIDSTFRAKSTERVNALRFNLCGMQAPELRLQDTLGNNVPLSSVKAKFTVIAFWDPNCGHCQKEMPKLAEIYKKFIGKDIKIYSVCIKREDPKEPGKALDEFKKFVREKGLGDMVNVWDKYVQNDFKNWYDVYSTPVMYLLDKDKKILLKRIGIEQMEDILNDMLEMDQKKN